MKNKKPHLVDRRIKNSIQIKEEGTKHKIFNRLQPFFHVYFKGAREQSSTQHTAIAYQKSTFKSLDLTNDSDNLGMDLISMF